MDVQPTWKPVLRRRCVRSWSKEIPLVWLVLLCTATGCGGDPDSSFQSASLGPPPLPPPQQPVLCNAPIRTSASSSPSGASNCASPRWRMTRPMHAPRHYPTATKLLDGRVLVVGGNPISPDLPSSEVFDPETETWTITGPLNQGRAYHTATLLQDGRVLVAGGRGPNGELNGSAEVYDPAIDRWRLTSPMNQARTAHTSTLLADGRVLVVGGIGDVILGHSEVFDPETETWTPVGALASKRLAHEAILLPDGRVLVAGGVAPEGTLPISMEIFDPCTTRWTKHPIAPLRMSLQLETLSDGTIVAAGGDATGSVGRFDSSTNQWTSLPTMTERRKNFELVRLQGEALLAVGGNSTYERDESIPAQSAEILNPDSPSWLQTPFMAISRLFGHRVVPLDGNRALVLGGLPRFAPDGPEASAEILHCNPRQD